ncbi:MAG TPA: polysaccharide biosynthesis/export family protein, partial [Longimicrobiales bacterium]
MTRELKLFTRLLCASLLTCASAGMAAAQQRTPTVRDTAEARRAIEQQFGRGVSQSEVLERIRQSGMSRAQIRARLQQAGYDPGLADRYYDILDNGGEPPRGEASSEFLKALAGMGITTRATLPQAFTIDSITGDTTFLKPQAVRDSMFKADSIADLGMQVFGMRTFRRAATQFEPILTGPVDRSYRLGPGDELNLVLTGDVEEAYALEVTRDGFIFIPDVGQIAVSGLTLGQLEDMLYSRLGRVYSGISRSPNATTRFQVSVGQLRTNQVFVRGEVTSPNAYQVSSVATVMTALYQAGGPTADGSFRHVEVHRGGQLVQVVDLYDFLVGGSLANDV